MHRISKTTTKLQQIFNINKLNYKIMGTKFQVVYQGKISKKIFLRNNLNERQFIKAIKELTGIEGQDLFNIIIASEYYV